ncbi:MAG: hypothetical protein ACAI35_21080 [Candidatus Methylacidiphilales bacterium]|nr:hypothetical protein [Candidatus Methylacidiphilales bacterium]
MLFLVSGASASGKTTLIRRLVGTDSTLEVHDTDEWLIEDAGMRCAQLEEWIRLALVRQSEGVDFLLGANSPLGELLACPSAIRLNGICACLLDNRDRDRIERMRARGVDPKWPPNQHHLNWAAWHRMHAWDPGWEQHVINRNGPSEHNYACWASWQPGDSRWRVPVFDTTLHDATQTVELVRAWIAEERGRPESENKLRPSARWWEERI